MNLLFTVVGFHTLESQTHVETFRQYHHIVELMPMERLTSYLLLDSASRLASVDAIVCAADTDSIVVNPDTGHLELEFPLTKALRLAEDVSKLPDTCAMRDGRKWKSIPFIVLYSRGNFEFSSELQQSTSAYLVPHDLPYYRHNMTLLRIQKIVDDYQDRILEDYRNVGIIIRFENGRAQIGPALLRKDPSIESEYYYAPADRRTNKGWVTVKRDNEGILYDVEVFQHLIDTGASETRMHEFFEEHPAFLMQARLGVLISHRPDFASPKGWKPDFAFSPIIGPHVENAIEVLELKGPAERILARMQHRGFSQKVHAAIDQVRDYDGCLRDPANFRAIEAAFGYIPKSSKLAVLIGRTPSTGMDREIFERRQTELNVQIITYDEILQKQTDQIKSTTRPTFHFGPLQ